MDKKPQFSVLLSFQNQRNEVEPSLTALYELENTAFELIVINDGSTDGTGEAIHSLIDYYQHDYTFFFDHERPCGRGNALNEAFQQSATPFIWAPRSIREIDEKKLQSALHQITNGSAPCLTQGLNLPDDMAGWAKRIVEGRLPKNGRMLWNKNNIAAHDQFFNPFLRNHHNTELLLRLGMDTLQMMGSFFKPSEFENKEEPTTGDKHELIMALLRRPNLSSDNRQMLTSSLLDLPVRTEADTPAGEMSLLEKAMKLKLDGQLSEALECVEEILDDDPGNPEAKRLKIKLLERKRRFVEASELKHEMQAGTESKNVHAGLQADAVKTTLIIPTALYGKPALEHMLISVNEQVNAGTTELIIIDNASLDDTHAYLQELSEKNFFDCRVITNQKNNGFAASINQGLRAARGDYVCIMHNDVELTVPVIASLEQLMDQHPEYALIGPLANSSLNPDQLVTNKEMYDAEIVETDYLDSFCMMLRLDADLSMDEAYTLAFFDDIDLSFQARKKGFKVGIAPDVEIKHHYGTTTFAIDLDTESELYWKNVAYFNDKWGIQTFSEEDLQSMGRFEQLLTLDEWVNPLYPEKAIKTKFDELFTDEMKTEIMKTKHEPEVLLHLIHLMMVMEKRDVMRRLEDRIGDIELPPGLIYEIVRFYFDRNVYSRCLHYLNQLPARQESMQSELYRLAILIDEKKIEEAIPMLTELLDHAPSNPLLYKLAGDIHAFENNTQEAESFYSLAHQINPFKFTETQKEIRLNRS